MDPLKRLNEKRLLESGLQLVGCRIQLRAREFLKAEPVSWVGSGGGVQGFHHKMMGVTHVIRQEERELPRIQ